MKLEKETAIVLSIIVTVLIVCMSVAAALGFSKSKERKERENQSSARAAETQTDTQTEDESKGSASTERKEYSYNNIDGLYFIPSKEHEKLKTAVEQYLSENDIDITNITVTGNVDTEDENFYTFWILLDSSMLIRGNYNYELDAYAFAKETDKEIISQFIDTSIPDDEDAPDDVYSYVELSIGNSEDLESFLTKEDFERLPDELLVFLDLQHELRRLFKVTDIKEENASVNWTFTFETPRIDGKNISVNYSKNTFKFTLE